MEFHCLSCICSPLYLILGIPVILWVALLICDASQVKEYGRRPGEPCRNVCFNDLGCSLHFYRFSDDSIAQPELRTINLWFFAIFPWLVALSKVAVHQALIHPNVCPNQPWARVNGLLTNPREGCCTLGLNISQIYTVSCAGEGHRWVFKLKLGCPITTRDYLNLN